MVPAAVVDSTFEKLVPLPDLMAIVSSLSSRDPCVDKGVLTKKPFADLDIHRSMTEDGELHGMAKGEVRTQRRLRSVPECGGSARTLG